MEQPKKAALLTRIVAVLVAAATLAVLIAAPEAGYVDPDVYEKTFLGGPGLGIHWVYMTGPEEIIANDGTVVQKGIPGKIIGTFCTHPRMSGGGDYGFTQYKNDERGTSPYLNAIIALSGMNATYLSEMRYAVALGLTNNLMDTQPAYWAYLHWRRPDLFDTMGGFQMTPENILRWFGSKPTSPANPTPGLTVPGPRTGLFVGDSAPVKACYTGVGALPGNAVPPQMSNSTPGQEQVVNDVAGPFSLAWDTADPAWSPALAQLNYGIDGNRAPAFSLTTPYVRMYTENPNANPAAVPVGSVPMGQDFYIKYVGPVRSPSEPLRVTVSSNTPITTKLLTDRFFYCYVAEYQYTVELERGPIQFTCELPVEGKEPPQPERPSVTKEVTQWDRATNEGPYEDMITVPKGSDSLYQMIIANPPDTDIVYKFGYRDLRVHPEDIDGVTGVEIRTLAQLQGLHNNTAVKKAKLMNDIVLPSSAGAAAAWTSINLGGIVLDGGGYSIRGESKDVPAKLNASVFGVISNGAALYNLKLEHLDIIYPAGRTANAGAVSTQLERSELRNVFAQGKLTVPYNTASRVHTGFIAGTIDTADNALCGVDVAADITVTNAASNDWFPTAAIAGDIYACAISDVRVLEGTRIQADQGELMAFGTFSGGTTAYNIEIQDGVILENTGIVESAYGIGWFSGNDLKLERFHIGFKYMGDSPRYGFFGIGDVKGGNVTDIKKGRVNITTAVSGANQSAGGVWARNGNTVNMSEVAVNASLSSTFVGGLAIVVDATTLNINNCIAEGELITSTGYPGGLVGHMYAGADRVNITNSWSSVDMEGSSNYKSKILSLNNAAAASTVNRSYAFGTALTGTGSRYIIAETTASTASGGNNYRTVDSGAPNDLQNGTYIEDSTCRGANAKAAMGGSGWSIRNPEDTDRGEIWVTAPGKYPVHADIGYNKVQVVYVHDYYEEYDSAGRMLSRVEVRPTLSRTDGAFSAARDLHICDTGKTPPWQRLDTSPMAPNGRLPQLYPNAARPPVAAAKAHIFVPRGGSFEFCARRADLAPGTYHNTVYLSPEHGLDWRGDEDDAWVEVVDYRAKLNIVKMLYDLDYLTTLDGCVFRLTKYNNLTCTPPAAAGTPETVSPRGMGGETFLQDLTPGCSYLLEEISAPANTVPLVPGGKWYITYTDTVRVYLTRSPATGALSDELAPGEVGTTTTVDGTTSTTVFSFKVVNVYEGDDRAKLKAEKYDEGGNPLPFTPQLMRKSILEGAAQLKIDYWTGAMYAVLRMNSSTGGDGDFTGGGEAFGGNLLVGHGPDNRTDPVPPPPATVCPVAGCGLPAGHDIIELPPGKYRLEELKPPDGYAHDPTPFWITLAADGTITVVDRHDPDTDQANYVPGTQNLRAVISYDEQDVDVLVKARDKKPDYRLELRKVDAAGKALPGVTFTVAGIEGTAYGAETIRPDSADAGRFVIDFPQPNGKYKITENAPSGYEPIGTIYVECLDGEMYLWGGPWTGPGGAVWQRGDIVIVNGGWAYKKSEANGVAEYTRIYEEPYPGMPEGELTLRDMGLWRLENTGVIGRAHIGLTAVNCESDGGSLTLKKLVTGDGADPNKAFTFRVSFTPPSDAIRRDGADYADGSAFTLGHGQSTLFTGIPLGTAYTVTEGDYSGDGYTVTEPEGRIRMGAVDVVSSAQPIVFVTYTNNFDRAIEAEIEGKKTVNGKTPPTGTLFAFRVLRIKSATDTGAWPNPDAFDETFQRPAGSWTYELEGLEPGVTYYYLVTELPGTDPNWTYSTASFIAAAAVGLDRKVTVTYAAAGGAEPTGDAIEFINTYRQDPTYIELPVRKYIRGIDVTDKEFTFDLEEVLNENGDPLPDGRLRTTPNLTITVPGSVLTYVEGAAKWGPGVFRIGDIERVDTYYYRITERPDADDADWRYSNNVYIARVVVTEDSTGLHAAPPEFFHISGSDGGAPHPDYAAFTNRYEGVPFSFIKKGKAGSATEPLAGVEFKLYKCGNPYHGPDGHSELATGEPGNCWDYENPYREAASGSGGLVEFGPLGSGDYMLAETRTRADYQLPLGQWLVRVDTGAAPGEQVVIVARGDMLPPAFYADDAEGLVLMNYTLTLPHAGVSTYTLLLATAGGSALVGCAALIGFGGVGKRRRKARS